MRRTLIIIAIVIVLTGIGIGTLYVFMRSSRVSITPNEGTNFPAAGQETPNTGVVANIPSVSTAAAETISTRLVEISTGPVVPGEAVIDTPAANASSSPDVAINYIERESGNIYSYLVHAATLTRTSNKTIPGIQSASWLPDASLAFVRYLSGTDFSIINTYALFANGSDGFFLPQNIADISVSSTSILTLASGVNGSIASLERVDGTHTTTVFTSPLSMLRISFAGKSHYLAFTKPSSGLLGDAFIVDSAGNFSRIAGPLNGLVALASPSGKWVLVSFTNANGMQMELVNTVTNEVIPLPVATIADKCVWTSDNSTIYCGIPVNPPQNSAYPDDWYKGVVHFTDRIWKIDVSGRYAQLVLDFSKATNSSLDAEALAVDPLNSVLTFVNKNDGSLWSYSL